MTPKRLHKESLLQFAPVRQIFLDPAVKIKVRGVDARWWYNKEFDENLSGFNPLKSTIYIGKNSYVEEWIKNKEKSARKYNHPSKKLIDEVLLLAHDYLHIWSFNWIHRLVPQIRVGEKKITKKNIEDYVFCHLLTEAVATVGLDYWYMCVQDVDKLCPIGVNFDGLTVSYRTKNEHEYQKFYTGFTAQRPDFLKDIAIFYCTGEFLGFGKNDLYRSPTIYEWLSHELTYGQNQRQYVREWYSYMSREDITYSEKDLKEKVDVSAQWKVRLMNKVGEMLWEKIKNDSIHSPGQLIDPDNCWAKDERAPIDYRFINFNQLKQKQSNQNTDLKNETNFKYWYYQFLAQHNYGKLDPQILELLPMVKDKRDPQLIRYLFRNQTRLPSGRQEPRDLFLLN